MVNDMDSGNCSRSECGGDRVPNKVGRGGERKGRGSEGLYTKDELAVGPHVDGSERGAGRCVSSDGGRRVRSDGNSERPRVRRVEA